MTALAVADCLTEALNQAGRWWGYNGNTPTNSRGSLFPEKPLFSWLSQAPRGTIRRSNNSTFFPEQPPFLTSAWLIMGVLYLPKSWVTEHLGEASPSSTGLEALSQGKMKMTCSKYMWKEKITKYFIISAHETYVEMTQGSKVPCNQSTYIPAPPCQFETFHTSYVCKRISFALLFLHYLQTIFHRLMLGLSV